MTTHLNKDTVMEFKKFKVHYPEVAKILPSTHIGLCEAVAVQNSWNQYVNPEWPPAVVGMVIEDDYTMPIPEPLVKYIAELERTVKYLDRAVSRAHRVIDNATRKLQEDFNDAFTF